MNQLEYIALLFADCGFNTSKQREAWLTREFKRPVKYADDLQSWERSRVIDILKDIKKGQQEKARADWGRDESDSDDL